MAESANERLLSNTIRHRVDISRYGAGVIKEVQKILEAGENELVVYLMEHARDNLTTRRLKAILRELGKINLESYKTAKEVLAEEMVGLAEVQAEQTAGTLQKVLPVQFSVTQPSAQQLVEIVSKDPVVVGKDGALLLEEIFKGLAHGRETKIRQAIRLGMVEGESIPSIVGRLVGTKANNFQDGIFQGNRRGATAMVRTVVNHVSNRAASRTYEENKDIIKGEKWVSTLDTRTTPICQARDGKVYPLGEGPRPPAHVNCRSFMVPILKSWREMGIDKDELPESTRASMDGQVPEDLTYTQWLRRNPGYAEEVLGKERAKLFLSGRKTLDKFVDDEGNYLTLKEIRARR